MSIQGAENLNKIFVAEAYLSQLPSNVKSSNASLYNHLLKTDISLYIDKNKVLNNCDTSKYAITEKESKINKFIFAQIQGHSNIAEPLIVDQHHYDNLDVVEKTESKFLQGEDDIGKKYEKIIWKFQFNDGANLFYGFEYEEFNPNEISLMKNFSNESNKFMKVLIGPIVEVRRGIFYLTKRNFRILG